MATKKTTATKKATKSTVKKVTKAVAKKNLVPLKDAPTRESNLVPLKDYTPSKKNLVPLKDAPTPKKENLVPIRDRYVPMETAPRAGSATVKGAATGAKQVQKKREVGAATRHANGLKKIHK